MTSKQIVSHPRAQTIDTDVLVIGGGVAGSLAAIGAPELGARVAVIDKGGLLERCGSIAAGVDQILAVADDGPEWDTPEYLLQHLPKLKGCTLCDQFCPGDIIYRLDPQKIPEIRYEDECWYCGSCEEYCPTKAVKIVFPREMLHSQTPAESLFGERSQETQGKTPKE